MFGILKNVLTLNEVDKTKSGDLTVRLLDPELFRGVTSQRVEMIII